MKFKLVIPAKPGVTYVNDPKDTDPSKGKVYWPESPQAWTEWGSPVASADSPYLLRDILVSKAAHDDHVLVHPLLVRLSPLTKDNIERDVERLQTRGQRTIRAVKSGGELPPVVIGGLRDLLACVFVGRTPIIKTVNAPPDLALAILADHVPERVPDAQRAASAVEALNWIRPESEQRMHVGKADPGTGSVPGSRDPEGRSTVRAAKIADIGRESVEKARQVRDRSPIIFEAMLSGRFRNVKPAHRAAFDKQLENEAERSEAIEILIANQSKPGHIGLRAYKDFLRRLHTRKNPLPEPKKNAHRFAIIHGDVRDVLRKVKTKKLKLHPYDLCFADPMWGERDTPDICEAIAELWKEVGKSGGLLCVLPGMGQHGTGTGNQVECATRMMKHLRYLCSGSYRMLNIEENNLSNVRRIEAMTLWFFSNGEPAHQLLGNEATSPGAEIPYDINQRNLVSIVELLGKMGMRPGMRVLDPTCCTGTTGVATIMLKGAFFTGIELDAERVEIAKRRCSKAEREDEQRASDELAAIARENATPTP